MSVPKDPPTQEPSDAQQQLDAKDQLIRALTDRLEEAAEQLDRVHRTGTDKPGRTGSGQGESAGPQHGLAEQLSRSLELWEDVQPRDAFERIEERLDELREMLEGARISDGAPGSSAGTATPKKKVDTLSGWEKMRAELMEQDSDETSKTATPQKPATSQEESSPPPAAPEDVKAPAVSPKTPGLKPSLPSFDEPYESLEELELPVPVDFITADREQLENAVAVRDDYISHLTRRLRSAEARTRQPVDWNALNNVPQTLRHTMERLETELNDKLRIAEVDLSLERARLARVENRIRGMQQQIERKLNQSVGTSSPDSGSKPDRGKPAPTSRSWFGSLGR